MAARQHMTGMPTYSIRDFRANLRAALARLAEGPVCVAGWGQRPVAYLISAADWERLQAHAAQPLPTTTPAARWQSIDSPAEPLTHWQTTPTAPGMR